MPNSYNYKLMKTVVVLSQRIEIGQALNVVGHLALSVGFRTPPEWMGRDSLLDKSGRSHAGISKFPIIITRAKPAHIRKALEQARQTGLILCDFPRQMLKAGHDDELAVSLAEAEEGELEYLGIIISGPADEVNAITGKFSLWK